MSKNPFVTTQKEEKSKETTSGSSHDHGHHSRPSHDLSAHERLVRKDARARRTIPRDQIDDLDNILGSYHHEGPFDATLASRQIPGRAPIEATKYGNSLALGATPKENLRHSLDTHEPLDGTSRHASGTVVAGRRYDYEEEDIEGRERPAKDYGSDDGGLFDGNLAEDEPHHGKKKDGDVEMESRGIVEYSADLDLEDDDRLGDAPSSSKHGVLNGLKKRLSIKR